VGVSESLPVSVYKVGVVMSVVVSVVVSVGVC